MMEVRTFTGTSASGGEEPAFSFHGGFGSATPERGFGFAQPPSKGGPYAKPKGRSTTVEGPLNHQYDGR